MRTLTLPACVLALLFGSVACRSPEQKSGEPPRPVEAARTAPASPGELLRPGSRAPELTLPTHTGDQVALASLRGKPVVVYFYPKDNTPGCTVQAQELRDAWREVQATGAVVFGVSADDVDSHRSFVSEQSLPFALVPDPEHRVAQAFGVPIVNGRAQRVTFVIDRQGTVARVFDEVNPRGSAGEVLAALRSLG